MCRPPCETAHPPSQDFKPLNAVRSVGGKWILIDLDAAVKLPSETTGKGGEMVGGAKCGH